MNEKKKKELVNERTKKRKIKAKKIKGLMNIG